MCPTLIRFWDCEYLTLIDDIALLANVVTTVQPLLEPIPSVPFCPHIDVGLEKSLVTSLQKTLIALAEHGDLITPVCAKKSEFLLFPRWIQSQEKPENKNNSDLSCFFHSLPHICSLCKKCPIQVIETIITYIIMENCGHIRQSRAYLATWVNFCLVVSSFQE